MWFVAAILVPMIATTMPAGIWWKPLRLLALTLVVIASVVVIVVIIAGVIKFTFAF